VASISTIRGGLDIFLRYGDSPVSADHDVVFAGEAHPTEMERADVERLEVLGWLWDSENCCWYHHV
jgi:hypothetical protein